MKSTRNAYLVLIILAIFYIQNISRLNLNSLNLRIKKIDEVKAYHQGRSATFEGQKDFYVFKKPLAICGVLDSKNIVLELTDLEILNIYEESKDSKTVLSFSYQDQYVIKNGQLQISGQGDISRRINMAYFYQDDRDIFLVKPGLLLTNSNCYQLK